MRIKNLTIVKRIVDIFKLQSEDFQEDISLVANLPLNRNLNIVKWKDATGTMYTTPINEDFYLTNIFLTMSKTDVQTGSLIRMDAIINGETVRLVGIGGVTGAFQNGVVVDNYPQAGIKIDRNTAITLTTSGTFTTVQGGIKGYTE